MESRASDSCELTSESLSPSLQVRQECRLYRSQIQAFHRKTCLWVGKDMVSCPSPLPSSDRRPTHMAAYGQEYKGLVPLTGVDSQSDHATFSGLQPGSDHLKSTDRRPHDPESRGRTTVSALVSAAEHCCTHICSARSKSQRPCTAAVGSPSCRYIAGEKAGVVAVVEARVR